MGRQKTMNSKCEFSDGRGLDRRTFLKHLAIAGGGVAVARSGLLAEPVNRYPCKFANRFRLAVEGTGDFRHVVGYEWPAILDSFPPDLKFRVRWQFPTEGRDIMSFLIFVAPDPEDALVGQPVPAEMLISGGSIWVQEIAINPPVAHPVYGPKPTLGLLGRVVSNPIPSPFGAIVGRTAFSSAAFDGQGDDVTRYLLGISSAGSHATFVREAKGMLHFVGQF